MRLLAVVIAAALVAGACGDDDDEEGAAGTTAGGPTTAAAGGDTTTAGGGDTTAAGGGAGDANATLTVGAVLAPPSLDITQESGAGIPQLLLYNVYETLVKIDDSGEFEPLLAESLPDVSEDGLTYTFTLREGVTFHNGDELTSEDVKFSLDRNKANEAAPSIIASTYSIVDSVEAPDPTTVVVTLTSRSRNWLYYMAQTAGVIIDEASVDTLANEANGSGPFELDTFTPPESARLTRY